MATITLMGPGPHHDIATRGTTIQIGDIPLDCVALQQNSDVTIDVFSADGQLSLQGPGAFAANVRIPARRWEDVTTEPVDEGSTDSIDSADSIKSNPLPLDPNAIEITLWPKA